MLDVIRWLKKLKEAIEQMSNLVYSHSGRHKPGGADALFPADYDIEPASDNTYGLGSDSYAWRRVSSYIYRLVPTSAPSSPTEGDMYYDSTEKIVKVYDGSQWRDLLASIEIVAEGTHTPSALSTEETVFETTEKGKYAGYISVANLQSGDTVTINLYVILKSGGSYELYDSVTLSGAQTKTVVPIYEIPVSYGMKITLNQTAGTIRSYDYVIFRVQK